MAIHLDFRAVSTVEAWFALEDCPIALHIAAGSASLFLTLVSFTFCRRLVEKFASCAGGNVKLDPCDLKYGLRSSPKDHDFSPAPRSHAVSRLCFVPLDIQQKHLDSSRQCSQTVRILQPVPNRILCSRRSKELACSCP